MATNYKARAKAWFSRAISEDDSFVKFILLYISFEVLAKEQQNNLRSLKHDERLRERFFKLTPTEKISELKNVLEYSPLLNMNPNGDHRWSGQLESINDFGGIIEFIIRARNNLFHGDKGLDVERDLFVIKWGNFLLQPLVGELLNDQ